MKILRRVDLKAVAEKYLSGVLELTVDNVVKLEMFRLQCNNEECRLNGGAITVPGEFTDQRGRVWETFVDEAYYGMTCVRPKGDKDFNSQLNFSFSTSAQAVAFAALLSQAC